MNTDKNRQKQTQIRNVRSSPKARKTLKGLSVFICVPALCPHGARAKKNGAEAPFSVKLIAFRP
jgi:uncharacterized protein YcgI (DUF1989 family)